MLTTHTYIVLQIPPRKLNNLLKEQYCVLLFCEVFNINQILLFCSVIIAHLTYWLSDAVSGCIKQSADIWLLGKNNLDRFGSRY